MKLFQGNGFQVIYQSESVEEQRAIDLLLQCKKRLRIPYVMRRSFLVPFVHLLASRTDADEMPGVRPLARLLHSAFDFVDADGGTNLLNAESIEDEIYKLRTELYPK